MFRHGNAAQAIQDVQHTSEKQWAMEFVESDESHVSDARLFGYVHFLQCDPRVLRRDWGTDTSGSYVPWQAVPGFAPVPLSVVD